MSAIFPADEPLLLSGPKGADGLKALSVVISETLGRPFRIEIEAVTEGPFLSPKAMMGQDATVLVNVGNGARYFHGLVSECHFLGKSLEVASYRLVLRPWVWFLSRAVNCRIFQRKAIPDIIREVFDAHQFSDVEPRLAGTYVARDFVVQYRESDLNFVTRLMEEEGIYYYFEHSDGRHLLILCDGLSAHEPVPEFESLPYFPPDSQRRGYAPHIDAWEVANRVEANVHATNDFDFTKPNISLLVRRGAPAEHALGDLEIYDYPGEYTTFDEGEGRARLRVNEQQALAETSEGHANARTITCGTLLGMTEHPVDELNAQYLILSTVLRLHGLDLASGGSVATELGRCSFVAIQSRTDFRLARTTPKPHILGVQTAVVTGPEGAEIWCDEYGRVRVRFHWDRRKDVVGDDASCWVRVSQLWAGAGFGGIHVPRVGQEVIVEFLEGDPDRPIITGRVYNALNMPPYELPKNQTQSGIKTATEKGELPNFNELRFEDAKGQEEIFIQAERNKTVKVKRSRSATIGGSDSISVGGNRSVSVTGDLKVNVGAEGGTYKLDATASADVIAPEYIELRCKDSILRLTPDAITLTAGGRASITIDARVFAESVEGSSLLLDVGANIAASNGAHVLLDTGVVVKGEAILIEGASLTDIKAGLVKINS